MHESIWFHEKDLPAAVQNKDPSSSSAEAAALFGAWRKSFGWAHPNTILVNIRQCIYDVLEMKGCLSGSIFFNSQQSSLL